MGVKVLIAVDLIAVAALTDTVRIFLANDALHGYNMTMFVTRYQPDSLSCLFFSSSEIHLP